MTLTRTFMVALAIASIAAGNAYAAHKTRTAGVQQPTPQISRAAQMAYGMAVVPVVVPLPASLEDPAVGDPPKGNIH